ncbi:hypothetical protein FISHEDRAFT_78688 [Fistulina hepatica ATCC 64428]|uniref:Uncharacterized protein n=1 Tax=Fistulina hepatica ATCC 64428 TaxID=1128425 RepID=A0A0D7A074_9AGAR|nr:hypothetical protein FISHEDRAFT_78688 [Fistulina hepatica ATCC 64428]
MSSVFSPTGAAFQLPQTDVRFPFQFSTPERRFTPMHSVPPSFGEPTTSPPGSLPEIDDSLPSIGPPAVSPTREEEVQPCYQNMVMRPSTPHLGHAPLIPRTFLEHLCHEFKLEKSQEDVLQMLVMISSQGHTPLSQADLACRLYQTAQLEDKDMRSMLEETFKLNKEQQDNVRSITSNILYSVKSSKFMDVNLQTFMRLEKSLEKYGMKAIFGSPHKERALRAFCKEMGTLERSKLQKDLLASITTRAVTLEKFTYNSSAKYKVGGMGPRGDPAVTAHNVLLRAATLHLYQKHGARSLEDLEEGDHDSIDGSDGSTAPPASKKCKAQGQIPRGESFWEKVELWFDAEIASWGEYNLSSMSWKQRVEELMAADQALFGGHTFHDEAPPRDAVHGPSLFARAPAGSPAPVSLQPRHAGRDLASLLL